VLQENHYKAFPGTRFKVEIMNLKQFLSGVLCIHSKSCHIIHNSLNVRFHAIISICIKVNFLQQLFTFSLDYSLIKHTHAEDAGFYNNTHIVYELDRKSDLYFISERLR
jgi:hypothetical protein